MEVCSLSLPGVIPKAIGIPSLSINSPISTIGRGRFSLLTPSLVTKSTVLKATTGDSRNGSYTRSLDTKYGKLELVIPRIVKAGLISNPIPDYARRTDDLETTIITLYKGAALRPGRSLTFIEKLYGHHYSTATVSNITEAVQTQVQAFHNRRPLSVRYMVIFMDATYLNVRRDSVAKEPLHVLLGITPEGNREVLDYAQHTQRNPPQTTRRCQSI